MLLALAAASLTFGSTMAGGIAAIRWPGRTEILMALAGGVVLGAALFDLLPEAVERAQELDISIRVPIGAVVVGFLFFHSVERFLHHDHHIGHDHQRPDPAGLVGAAGFVVHSFFDGLAIGLGFQIASGVGLVVTAAVVGHDFSDGLNTVSFLSSRNHPESRSRQFLVADALAPLLGALVAYIAPVLDEVFPIALGFFSGLFVYAATTSLLPAAESLAPRRSIPVTVLGAAAMFAIAQFACRRPRRGSGAGGVAHRVVLARLPVAHVGRPSRSAADGVRGIEAKSGDHQEGVLAVRIDRDPAAEALDPPARKIPRDLGVVEVPARVKRIADRAGAVITARLEAAMAAAEAVGVALGDPVGRGDDGLDRLRRRAWGDGEAVDELAFRAARRVMRRRPEAWHRRSAGNRRDGRHGAGESQCREKANR